MLSSALAIRKMLLACGCGLNFLLAGGMPSAGEMA